MMGREESAMRVIITGGKTGGHVAPAIAVVESLRRLSSQPSPGQAGKATTKDGMVDLLYVGIKGGIEERIAPAHDIPLLRLSLTTPEGLLKTAVAAMQMGFGVVRSLLAFLRFRPHVLFSTGGFVS